MNDANKERWRKINAEIDRASDSVLTRIIESPSSWAVFAVSHAVAFALGWWFGR